MRNKGLAFVFVVGIAALSVGLTACGKKDVDNITAATNPADIVSDEVEDAAAWRSAFDYSKRTNFSYKETSEHVEDGQIMSQYSIVLDFDSDKYGYSETSMVVSVYGQENEQGETVTVREEINKVYNNYAAVIDGKNYVYEYDAESEKWSKTEKYYDVIAERKLSLIELYNDVYNGFERFSYADGMYSGTLEDEYITEYSVKIKYGRVVYISYVSRMPDKTESEYSDTNTLFIYNVNKTTVTLPVSFEKK